MADCVCNIVRDIVEAQDQANNNNRGNCPTSCESSIQDLLSPGMTNNNGPDTVPFMLYCEGDCNPFIASGVYRNNGVFNCLESPIFRAKEFTDDNECCVRLELLAPADEIGGVTDVDGDDVCDFFGNTVTNFMATGICITVDLNTFNGIQCLDAVTPYPYSQFVNNA
ncbi:spore coat protein CotY [Lentibacillus halophilus]|uniref:Spore coat protein CotY n=1 Tax=Lentibacillus halophilus TaxID=295065 RepID=A0ABN0Z369_9BACI